MKISIIGSEGRLGRALRRVLGGAHDVRRVDVNGPNEPNTLRGDVRSQEDMERAVDGVDVVVHLAAYHGGYVPQPTDETRFDVNVLGTFRVLQACLKKDVRRVVWGSSMAALRRDDIYCITKVLGEDLCDYYHERHEFQIAMMRYDAFTACDLVSYGEWLLVRTVDLRDAVAATVRAVGLLGAGQPLFGRFSVSPRHPYSREELQHFGDVWEDVLRRRDPEYVDLVQRYGIEIPCSVSQHDLSSASEAFGWAPRYNFDTFLAELKERDAAGEVTPESPRWRFETGVPPPVGVVWARQEDVSAEPAE